MNVRFGSLWLLVALAIAPLLGGCARNARAEMEHRIEVADRERDPELLLARACAFAEIGDYTRAEQYIDLARKSGADERRILPLLLDVCIKDQRYRAAVQHTEDYLRKRPSEFRLRFMLASLYLALGEPDDARRELETVLAAAPKYADAHYTLAVVLRDELGRPSEADQHFRTYLALSPRGSHSEEAEASLLKRVP